MIKIGLHGSSGKMGQEIIALLRNHPKATLSYSYCRTQGDLESLCSNSDIIIDFSFSEAISPLLKAASNTNVKLLIGTTGINDEDNRQINILSNSRAIIQTSNTSLGITLLKKLVHMAAGALTQEDIDIIDIHHATKKDSPSGTALMLGKAAAQARQLEFIKYDQPSTVRPKGAIGFAALRAGAATGEHIVSFSGESEVLTLSHRTTNRKVFAEGAIKAAIWLNDCSPGLYTMEDVLGI